MTPSLPQTSASFTGNKLKRKMSQGTSKQSRFLRTEITNTPNSRVYRQSCVAETFAQLHKVSLYRERPGSSRREEARREEGTEGKREGGAGWAGVLLLWWSFSPLQGALAFILSANQVWWWTPCNPAVMGWRQEDQFKVILSYIASPRPIWEHEAMLKERESRLYSQLL